MMTSFKWVPIVFAVIFLLGVAFDIWLVLTGRQSISWQTWVIERGHPTILAGILLIGMMIAWLMWSYFFVAAPILIVTGHLITNDAALSAVAKFIRRQ
jgi:hypothetical protein